MPKEVVTPKGLCFEPHPVYDKDCGEYVVPIKAAPGHNGYLTERQLELLSELRKILEAPETLNELVEDLGRQLSDYKGLGTGELENLRKELPSKVEEALRKTLSSLALLRFLRARKWTISLATKPHGALEMLKDYLKWRASYGRIGVERLRETFQFPEKPQVREIYPQYYHKTDKLGRPIYVEELGKITIKGLEAICANVETTAQDTAKKLQKSEQKLLDNYIYEYERMVESYLPACSRASKSLQETSCSIIDCRDLTLGGAWSASDFILPASRIMQNFYPERLGQMVIINAPWGFSTAYSVLKKALDPVTTAKIEIFGYDQTKYQPFLQGLIDKANLPKKYGGTCECEGGCSKSNAGPWNESSPVEPS